jgi:hypothetical protein
MRPLFSIGVGANIEKGESTMSTKITGTFSGKIRGQAATAISYQDNHILALVAVAGPQKTADPLWQNVEIAYWGSSDLVNGSGPQSGYWCNHHANGDRDWGTFEGKVITSGQQVTMQGTYKWTGGTGKFKGISGGGTYKGHFPSPTDVVNNWEGEYTLA